MCYIDKKKRRGFVVYRGRGYMSALVQEGIIATNVSAQTAQSVTSDWLLLADLCKQLAEEAGITIDDALKILDEVRRQENENSGRY